MTDLNKLLRNAMASLTFGGPVDEPEDDDDDDERQAAEDTSAIALLMLWDFVE